MRKTKIGVIGTGHLGKLHAKMLNRLAECELVGVFDRDLSIAIACGNEHNVEVYTTLEELLANVAAVSIAATTSAHHKIAKQCLEAGKHIFIEKPITSTIEEAEELVLLADDRNLKIQVGHIERFNPALLAIEKYLNKPMFIQCDRLSQFNPRGTDVAVVLDLMIHDIDIILNLVGSEVSNISASGVAVVSDNIDIANARLEFENGAVAIVTASRISQKKMRKMRLFEKDRYLSLDFVTGVSEVFSLLPIAEQLNQPHISYGEIGIGDKKKKIIYEQPEVLDINALEYELKLFVSAISNDTEPVVTGRAGLKALKVAEAIISKIDDSMKKIIASN